MCYKISIITPVYNAEKYLDKTVESIIAQDYTCWELILVDDGSTDESGNICDEYALKDFRIKVFHQKNQGVSAARNLALEKISGDYVTFIDSDDWIEPNYLCHFAEFFNADDQIIYQGYAMDYEGKVFRKSIIEIPESNQILHLGAIWGKCFSVGIIQKNNIKFDERLNLHEDHVFYYECLKYARQFEFSTNVGYHYMHYGEQSLSRRLQSSSSYFLASDLLIDYYQYDITAIDEKYKRFCIQKFGLNQMVMGIFSLYFEKNTRKQRVDILKDKQNQLDLFKKYFVPNSINGRLFSYCYMYLSPVVQDIIFKVVTTLLGSHFKLRLNLK